MTKIHSSERLIYFFHWTSLNTCLGAFFLDKPPDWPCTRLWTQWNARMASQHVETLFRGGPSTALESVDPEQNQMRTPAYCSSTGPACYCLILTTDAKCIKSKSHLKHCPGQLQVPTSATSYLDTASRDDRQCEMSSTKCQCQATAAQRIGIAFTKLLQSI